MEENNVVIENASTANADKKFCTSCGAELHPEAVMCPSCGTAVAQAAAENAEPKGFKKLLRNKIFWAILGGALVVIAIVVIIAISSYRNSFDYHVSKMLDECETTGYINNARSSDGKTLKMDTNPTDTDPDDWDYFDSKTSIGTLDGIEWMNEYLGFSSTVFDDMMETNSLMGRQSASCEDYTVSWTYHPDKGLEVTYTKK